MAMVTAKELAAMLDGREYRREISDDEAELAKESGLVVVFGASDDLMEFRGAIYDEADCCDGGSVLIHPTKGLIEEHECDCEFCGYKEIEKYGVELDALWCCEDDFSWTYATKIPHETFIIKEDGVDYCRGIVFALVDIKKALAVRDAQEQKGGE